MLLATLLSGCFDKIETAPEAPGGLSATPGDQQVTVNWSSVSDAKSYILYWATTTGVTTGSTKVAGASRPYTHTGRTNGQQTCYRVSGVNATGEGPLSSEVCAMAGTGGTTYTVGGTITGLVSSGLVLRNNGGDNLTITAGATSFTLTTRVAYGSTYAVTLFSQPTGQTCTVTGGSGTMGTANVTTVSVTCTTNTYTVGGTVSGLTGTLVLRNNGGDDRTITTNGTFTFATPVPYSSPYAITVFTQPIGQTCSVTGGSGTMGAANVTTVSVTCTTNTYTVGGTISGLVGSGLVMLDNGGDNLTLSAGATLFVFATRVAYGSPYAVTVFTQPTGQTCSVTGGSGTMGTANVTTVSVTCSLALAVGNLHDRGVTHSGFLVGTAGGGSGGVAAVQVSLDGGAYASATGMATWSFQLPSGGSTWREGSVHTIAVRARDAGSNLSPVVTLNVRKGVNQDVNGDGYADVVVGASGANSNAGAAYVFLSAGASGIPGAAYTSANATLTGPSDGGFGYSVALGDVNGDGYADVVVGAPGAVNSEGRAYVFQSAGASGISSTDYTSANATLTGPASSYFGYSVALGDVNGDGYADMVVGAACANGCEGAAYVFQSAGASGIAGAASTSASTTLTGFASSGFGASVVLGDVNGDDYADVVVGAYSANAAYVFQSAGASGIASAAYTSAHATLTGPSFSFFARSVALGDVNGDGYADVIVGADRVNAAYVFQSAGAVGIASAAYTTANATLTDPTSNYAGNFARSLAVGDVNGDGFADVVVGAYRDSSEGAAYVFQSAGASGIASAASTSANATLTGPAASYFGWSVALGDVNGDGYVDVVVGAITTNTAYVFQSAGASGIASAAYTSANATLTGPSSSDFGWSVSLGEIPVYPLLWVTLGGVWRGRRERDAGA